MKNAAALKITEKYATIPESAVSVLIVDDDPIHRTLIEMLLTNQGYAVTTAQDGKEALERMNRNFFPIVITDWMMPEIDGIVLCQTLREISLPGYVYVIFATVRGSRKDFFMGMGSGADDYLVKPVDPLELEARMAVAKRIIGLERSLKCKNDELARLSFLDPLTKLYNRRYLNENLPLELKRVQRYTHPMSVVLGDIDHFKQLNDRHGHVVGDAVLKSVFRALVGAMRRDLDWAVRYGGDEFLVVLPEVDLPGAKLAAERYRLAVARHRIATAKHDISVTASFGVATFRPEASLEVPLVDLIISTADRCLYQAKRAGRNRVEGALLDPRLIVSS